MLIRRYGATTVAPFSMLVPFFGIASAALFLGEPSHGADMIGGVLVIGGVLIGAHRRPPCAAGVRPDAAAMPRQPARASPRRSARVDA